MNENAPPKTGLRIEDLHAGYGSLKVLQGFTLTLEPGECVALIGPNGAGKSTLLEVIVGGIHPTGGSLKIPEDHEGRGPELLRVAQIPDLPPFLSLIELVILGLKGWRQDLEDPLSTATELLEKWGLSSRLDRPTRLASPGEIRRALFALVEGVRPKVLLLDEALSALDPAILVRAEALISELSEEGCSTLFVTHDMGLAERIPERVALLHKGVLSASWSRAKITEARSNGASLLDMYLETTSNSEVLL